MSTLIKKVTFEVPTRDQVSENNQAIFDKMLKSYGMIPNLYAFMAWNETALGDYLALQGRKSTLSGKEREIINLVVSEINNCDHCRRAHSFIANKMVGFTGEQVVEIRKVKISFDEKFQALAKFVKETTINKGKPSEDSLNELYEAGYANSNLIDIVMVIGDKIISNYLHNITHLAIEWPEVPAI
jgi:uncharacterized peroxidase-related enzyme